MNIEFKDIPEFQDWRSMTEIDEGWSKDKKYYIEDHAVNRLLLRVTDIGMYEEKKKEFDMIKKLNALNFIMSQPISFGVCNDNRSVYMLLGWVDGRSLREILPRLSEEEQYAIGVEAGKILKAIHSIPVDDDDIPAEDKKEHKLRKLEKYERSSVRVEHDEAAIDYVRSNLHKINPLPPVYKHGDYHVGNLILSDNHKVGVIDFNRWNCGDRYEEFYKMQSFDVEVSIPFSIGQIDGYFDNRPPTQFWDIVAVHVAHSALCLINWAEKFEDKDEVNNMQQRCLIHFRTTIIFEQRSLVGTQTMLSITENNLLETVRRWKRFAC